MALRTAIKKNTYRDSVSLMTISTSISKISGVDQAFVAMGTDMNKEVLRSIDLLTDELEQAGAGDMMIVVSGEAASAEAAYQQVDDLLQNRNAPSGSGSQQRCRVLSAATQHLPGANLAVISVNGAYAVREARRALENGLHVMLFSDNVDTADEVALKSFAHDNGLLMMGPDCGTAMINNVALCFGNGVRRGNIGIVGASGTGSQEISVRIHHFGGGISQLIGTGGRDLSEAVGGIMMLDGLEALEADPATEVIVLVSKPPAPAVEARVLARVKKCRKPVVVCFIGGSMSESGVKFAGSTKEAALAAVVANGAKQEELSLGPLNWGLIREVRAKLTAQQRFIRGLFCGGTLCDEAMYRTMEMYDEVHSNIHPHPDHRLHPAASSIGHTFLDFGDDAFTQGRPHPMIDPSNRIARLEEEAKDPEVGVIVLDFILGHGSHKDPVGVTLPAIVGAKQRATAEGRHLEILGYVLGTDLDRPAIGEQVSMLEREGVTIASSSTNAGLLAREFVRKDGA